MPASCMQAAHNPQRKYCLWVASASGVLLLLHVSSTQCFPGHSSSSSCGMCITHAPRAVCGPQRALLWPAAWPGRLRFCAPVRQAQLCVRLQLC